MRIISVLMTKSSWEWVSCHEVIGHGCLIYDEEGTPAIKVIQLEKQLVVLVQGGRLIWLTDSCQRWLNSRWLAKEYLVHVYKGKGDPIVCCPYSAIKLLEQPINVRKNQQRHQARKKKLNVLWLCGFREVIWQSTEGGGEMEFEEAVYG